MDRPVVKPAHRPFRRSDGKIWIGSIHYGLGVELDDASGLVWALCQWMDGNRATKEIVAGVAAEQCASVDDVGDVVDFLIASGWVEDAGAPIPVSLSAAEVERYARSAHFLSWIDQHPRTSPYELQARLKASRVGVIGLGGIGSAVALNLAASGVGHLHCVDGDVVELSNLNRQVLYTEHDLGQRKVDAAVQRLRTANRHIEVTGTDLLIDGPDTFSAQVRDADVFVLCADEPDDIGYWANEVALQTGLPWVTASYAGPMLMVGTFVPAKTGCYACLWDGAAERWVREGRNDLPLRTPKPAGYHPVIAPTAQASGTLAALEVLYLLLDMPVQTAGRMLHRNFLDYEHQYYIEASRRPDCPACGDGT
jgi:molybdopterin/thiamine biosynthesis adenylyltransferase